MASLAEIDAFRPSARDDNWRELDDLLQALGPVELSAVPTLLRVFERFPRHDGHGVFWTILHAIERAPGFEEILVEHVMRTPTEMGVTMLQRLVNSGVTHAGVHELAPLVVMLSARAPIIDYTIEPAATHGPAVASPIAPLLARLEAFNPPERWDTDWSPLREIVDELVATNDVAIATPLLRTLDRFSTRDGFAPFWPIVNGLEQLPGWPTALVASMQATPTKTGLTLLLRLLAREVTHVDGVDVAALAAERMAAG
ncbi:MAG: hypothetical protein M4D80_25460 [Myxococcota bacterium]|nr:hypothetical protein [Deltaproteobacteria bacterium]MDQ3338527.1 hypothetical protein [Myxococcota bacterium]